MAVTGDQTAAGGGTGRAGGVGTPGVGGGFGGNRSDNFGGNPRDTDQEGDRGLGKSSSRLGRSFGPFGKRDKSVRARIFTPAQLAAEAARRELLRILASQGQGATILASSPAPSSGASIFGG